MTEKFPGSPEGTENPQVNIKEIGPEHWKELRDLYLKLLETDPGAFVDEYEEIASREEGDWQKSLEKKGKTFVAEEENKLVGMGRINFYDEIPGVPVLHKLGVLPEYRGKGIARKLINAREEWARSQGAEKVRLYVIADREKTIEFSKKNGYKITETLENNFQKPDSSWGNVLVMEKDLA